MATGDAHDTHQGSDGGEAESTQTSLEERFAKVPPLAALAAATAVVHVVLQRLVLPLWVNHAQQMLPMWVVTIPRFTLNLTAAAALTCLAWTVATMVREAEYTHASRRTLIALLAGGVFFVAGASMLLRAGHVTARTVLLGAGAAHALTVQFAMAALRSSASLAGRTSAGLIAAAALFPLASMLLRQLMPLGTSLVTGDGVAALHGLGELAYLLAPIAAAFVFVPWGESRWSGRARAAGAVATFVMGLLFAAAAKLPSDEYGQLLYATLRLEWALERASLGYAVPVSLAAGGATAALLSDDARHRQGGMAAWLWLAAGYNPLSPARLLLWSLSAALLSRALVSLRRQRMGTGATEAV